MGIAIGRQLPARWTRNVVRRTQSAAFGHPLAAVAAALVVGLIAGKMVAEWLGGRSARV